MIKDIVVHLDGNEMDEVRIAHAEQLASRHGAFVTGVYVNRVPDVAISAEPSSAAAQVIFDQQNAAAKAGEEGMGRLKPRFERLGVNNDLRRFDVFGWQAGEVLAAEARTADVFIDLRPYGHPAEDPQTVEQVMFGSGRSTLLVPPDAAAKDFDTVMVCWRDTREAARAITESLPILKMAEAVHVVMVDEGRSPDGEQREPGADVARHLDRHGVHVELVHARADKGISATLLRQAETLKADVIVMGGYGHSRFREWALGGVTLDILTRAMAPVLVAH